MNLPDALRDSVTVAFWASFLSAALLAWPIYKLLLLTKSRQTISQHAPSTHMLKQGTPTMGGIILVAGFLFASVGVAYAAGEGISLWALIIFIGFALIGFIDDFLVPRLMKGKRGLGWKQKFIMQALVAGAGVYAHGGRVLDVRWGLITFLILFMANAYNFADGLDALAGSILLVFGAGLLVLAQQGVVIHESAAICAALIGGVIPFLFLNAPPAKVFMGDVGSLPVGAVLGLAVGLVFSPKSSATAAIGDGSILDIWEQGRMIEGMHWRPEMVLPLAILCLVMVIEIVPVPLQIAWVKLFKRRLFPFTPIHHAFEKAGWPETRVVWTFALSQLVLVALALLAFQVGPPSALVKPSRPLPRVEARL